MIINGNDALQLKKYDAKVLEKIYQKGIAAVTHGKESLSKEELALVTSAGYALDLVNSLKLKAAKRVKGDLDFRVETQQNIANAVLLLVMADLQNGIPENEVRYRIAKKVSSYLLFQMWNFYQSGSPHEAFCFELAMAFDLARGRMTVSKQGIWIIDGSNRSLFDVHAIGQAFAEENIRIIGQEQPMVGVEMGLLSDRIRDMILKVDHDLNAS